MLYSTFFDGTTLFGVGASGQVAELCGLDWSLEPPSADRATDLLAVAALDRDHILVAGPMGTLATVTVGPARQTNHL